MSRVLEHGQMSPDSLIRERSETHGDFADVARISQVIRYQMRESRNWSDLSLVKREALDCIVGKIARILSGDSEFPDHWRDIQGYARLGEQPIVAASAAA